MWPFKSVASVRVCQVAFYVTVLSTCVCDRGRLTGCPLCERVGDELVGVHVRPVDIAQSHAGPAQTHLARGAGGGQRLGERRGECR